MQFEESYNIFSEDFLGMIAKDTFCRRVEGCDLPLGVDGDNAFVDVVDNGSHPDGAVLFASLDLVELLGLEFMDGPGREGFEGLLVGLLPESGTVIHDGQGAKAEAITGIEGVARVETGKGLIVHKGGFGEARIESCILDDKRSALTQDLCTEGVFEGDLGTFESQRGFPPDSFFVDQADGNERDIKKSSGEAGDSLKALFRGGIEEIELVKGVESCGGLGDPFWPLPAPC